MKKNKLCLFILLAGFMLAGLAYSQDNPADRATVPFSDPSKPGLVKVAVHRGAIAITGYNGKEVIVEAQVRSRAVEQKEENKKASGMKLIQMNATGLSISEEDNVMKISVDSLRRTIDVTVRVPFNTSLKVTGFMDGGVKVDKVTGELEITNHNGGITLSDVSGNVIANTFNGELMVTFQQIDQDKPMSFTTWNGDVDVTFPGQIKADVKLKSDQGDIYSDYDIQLVQKKQEAAKEGEGKEGKYKITFDKTIYGKINGGGPEYTFKTFNGDIFVRLKK